MRTPRRRIVPSLGSVIKPLRTQKASPAISSPPAHPRIAAPPQTRIGKRSMSDIRNPAPNITRGADKANPNTIKLMESCAAAAIAKTLSRDMTALATMIEVTALNNVCLASISLPPASSKGSFIAMKMTSRPPKIFQIRHAKQIYDDQREGDSQRHGAQSAENHSQAPPLLG